jgi:hypothetical protein
MSVETKSPDATKPSITPLQATVELVRRGHRDQLPRLREQLAQQPAVYQYVGDLSRQAERAWVELLGGNDDLLKESVVLFATELKKSLAGEKASPIEALAAERIAACWMELEYHRLWLAQHTQADGSKVTELHERRLEQAHRRLERSMANLASIKRLLPRTIQVELRQTAVPPVTTPIVGGAVNGEMPAATASHRQTPMNGTPGPVNRVNGLVSKAPQWCDESLEVTGAKP